MLLLRGLIRLINTLLNSLTTSVSGAIWGGDWIKMTALCGLILSLGSSPVPRRLWNNREFIKSDERMRKQILKEFYSNFFLGFIDWINTCPKLK